MSFKSLIDKPEELLELIDSYLKPKQEEKKKFGEVFTPLTLINEMLDKLDEYYIKEHGNSIFTKKNFKWLDPANGIGNFPIAIYFRLMKGLKKKIKDKKERKKHILENMLYMIELNKKNVIICKEIFDINNEYNLNLYNGDSLTLDIEKEWGIKKFDVIVGNPPYQETGLNNKSKGGTNLYTKFINKYFNKVKSKKYFMFITPISWLGPSKNKQMGSGILHNIFLKYDLLYLNLNECKKYFNVGSTFSYYILKKSINEIKTYVKSEYKKNIEYSEINFKKLFHFKFLPIHITDETISLINNIITKKYKLRIERCRKLDSSIKKTKNHLSLTKSNKFKYITYHTTSKTYYSDIKLDIYDKSKIILNMAGYLKPLFINNCNLTESKFYIIPENKTEAEEIIKLLKSNEVIEYLSLCKYSGFNSRLVLESITYN